MTKVAHSFCLEATPYREEGLHLSTVLPVHAKRSIQVKYKPTWKDRIDQRETSNERRTCGMAFSQSVSWQRYAGGGPSLLSPMVVGLADMENGGLL